MSSHRDAVAFADWVSKEQGAGKKYWPDKWKSSVAFAKKSNGLNYRHHRNNMRGGFLSLRYIIDCVYTNKHIMIDVCVCVCNCSLYGAPIALLPQPLLFLLDVIWIALSLLLLSIAWKIFSWHLQKFSISHLCYGISNFSAYFILGVSIPVLSQVS